MDRHRVSHKVYHAMRKAGKQSWPSPIMIKKEKGEMSKEIPFTTEQEVKMISYDLTVIQQSLTEYFLVINWKLSI